MMSESHDATEPSQTSEPGRPDESAAEHLDAHDPSEQNGEFERTEHPKPHPGPHHV